MLDRRKCSASYLARGVSLVELMVGLTVGLVIMAGAVALFAKISFSGLENTRRVQLNEQLRSTLNLMHKDLQRAGYVDASDGAASVVDIDDDAMALFGLITIADTDADGVGDCITYSYDYDGNGIQTLDGLKNVEMFGFRLSGGVIQRATVDADCGGAGNWEGITDASVTVQSLTFTADSYFYEVSRDNDGNGACDVGETCLERRKIEVDISGYVTREDPDNASTLVVILSDEIKVKNDHYYVVPVPVP